jgi:hypothetical protein
MAQYIHLVTNSGLGLPTDLWVPATRRVRPQQAHQVAVGVARTFGGGYAFSLEGYYKTMEGLVEYREGAEFLGAGKNWQDNVAVGDGVSYGAEVFVQKKQGRTTGWLGYTLARTDRRFEDLNFGRSFPYKYDRRHDAALVLTRHFTPRLDVSGTWTYGTGNAVTLPVAHYREGDVGPPVVGGYSFPIPELDQVDGRNGFRMRAYHRLDVGMQYRWPARTGEQALRLGFYNLYNRKNPFFYYLGYDVQGSGIPPVPGKFKVIPRVRQVSLFPILPSLSYSLKF